MTLSQLTPKEISIDHVLKVIAEAERHHRIVWTAGRVLKEDGSLHQVMTGDPMRRKAVLRRLRAVLKTLARAGVLAERGLQFNFGADHEVSYDLVQVIGNEAPATDAGGDTTTREPSQPNKSRHSNRH
jgi:hypothetical protein